MHDFLSSSKCDFIGLAETWPHIITEYDDRNHVVVNNILPNKYSIKHLEITLWHHNEGKIFFDIIVEGSFLVILIPSLSKSNKKWIN